MKELYKKTHFKGASDFALKGENSTSFHNLENNTLNSSKQVVFTKRSKSFVYQKDLIGNVDIDWPTESDEEDTNLSKNDQISYRRILRKKALNNFDKSIYSVDQKPVKNGVIPSRPILDNDSIKYMKKIPGQNPINDLQEISIGNNLADSNDLEYLKKISSYPTFKDSQTSMGNPKAGDVTFNKKSVKFYIDNNHALYDMKVRMSSLQRSSRKSSRGRFSSIYGWDQDEDLDPNKFSNKKGIYIFIKINKESIQRLM